MRADRRDTAQAARHEVILRGLLAAILDSGDGRGPATAWPVLDPREEAPVLRLRGVDGRDRVEIERDGHGLARDRVAGPGGGPIRFVDFNVDLPRGRLAPGGPGSGGRPRQP